MKVLNNITLLLPVYNGGQAFEKMLNSLERLNAQINLIIFDDGSIDDTYKIACDYALSSKHKISVIYGYRNRGYFRVIKILLRLCTTNFFIFLGHDDQISVNYFDEFEGITLKDPNIACIFTDVSTLNPGGEITNTWPNSLSKDQFPRKIPASVVIKSFNRHSWGNLFVAIWSKRVMNHRTFFQIMNRIPDSELTIKLKRMGFMNDHLAVLRVLSFNRDLSVHYNKTGVYFKEFDPERLSAGKLPNKNNEFILNPLGYIALMAYFILPQIKQKSIVSLWMVRYLYIYCGITVKSLIRNPTSFGLKIFLKGLVLLFGGYANSLMDFNKNKG